MRLDKFIAKSRIIDLQSTDYKGAINELLDVTLKGLELPVSKGRLSKMILEREQSMTTCLGNGVALPHVRVAMKRKYIFAIGRCPDGLDFEGVKEYKDVKFVLLLLASDQEKSYLNILASLAQILQDPTNIGSMVEAPSLEVFRQQVMVAFGGAPQEVNKHDNKYNRLILREAEKVARGAQCSSILVFGDTFSRGIDLTHLFPGFNTVLVSQTATDVPKERKHVQAVIPVRSFTSGRLSQLRSAVLVGMTRGIFKYNDRICCIGGLHGSDQFDTIVVVDIEREFQSVFTKQSDILPHTVKPEVLERVIAIATELSVEGREGRPIGSLFVLGDVEHINKYTKPLVLNPFYGYKAEDRNILNPFMDETIKEFSSMDGAFVIRGDGVIESAGTLIHAPDYYRPLPSGLGTRHSAGMAISEAADCISITISASSGQVSLFRRGQMLPLIERSAGRGI